ncbi:MAG: large subunit ribosomal protein L6 [Flavobacteriaceae bacterium]|jgi:large subunit ribosomal protein L6
MSRIGNNPISVPEGVTIDIQPALVTVKGKLGELTQEYSEIEIKMEDNTIYVTRTSENKSVKAKHGLYRALIFNMIEGVSKGFTKELELVGVGYRASNQGQKLDLALGFSHNILIDIAPEVKVETVSDKGKNPLIKLSSHDKQLVGYIASKIRSFRRPEPYKGKGVKYVGEQIRRKAGKSA